MLSDPEERLTDSFVPHIRAYGSARQAFYSGRSETVLTKRQAFPLSLLTHVDYMQLLVQNL